MAERNRNENLIIQTAFLGDLLLSIPLIKFLRRLKPEDKITILARRGLGQILSRSGLVDEVIEADKSSRQSWREATGKLRGREFNLLICPHESVRSASLVFSLRARRKIGYRHALNFMIFNDRVPRPMELPETLRQLALLQPIENEWTRRLADFARLQTSAGGQQQTAASGLVKVPEWADMSIPSLVRLRDEFRLRKSTSELSDNARALAERLNLSAGSRIVFLAPGSVWPTKMWTEDGYTTVANEFLSRGDTVLLTGAPDEKSICDRIAKRASGAISIAGLTSLYESAELMALADLVVCNDSGAMHLAAAAAVPSVSMFGPTILEFGYRPWQNHARVVQVAPNQLTCRPCGKHGAKTCPVGTHDCMKLVSATQVLAAADSLRSADTRN